MTLDQYIALLQSADATINAENARLLTAASDEMRAFIQTIAHRKTGNMANSMHRLGPFTLGAGILETVIESGAWYAEEEVSRGGDHDWAARAIEEDPGIIDRLQIAIETAAASALVGGA